MLLKWTNYINGWQQRYFTLRDGILSYYTSESDIDTGCKGALKVSVCEVVGMIILYLGYHTFIPALSSFSFFSKLICFSSLGLTFDSWSNVRLFAVQHHFFFFYYFETNRNFYTVVIQKQRTQSEVDFAA